MGGLEGREIRAHRHVGDAEGVRQLGHPDELTIRDDLQHPLAPERGGQELGLPFEHRATLGPSASLRQLPEANL